LAISRREERRALDADELELVDRTHHPEVADLSDSELRDLIRLVRERRDRAGDIASQRRREMRGKSAPRGAEASKQDDGSRLKREVLAMAGRRLNAERSRRKDEA